MKKRVVVGLAIALFAIVTTATYAVDEVEAAKTKAVALVDKGIAYITSAGKDKAFKDFTDKNGGFVDGEFYIFVVDFTGLTLGHGGNPALVGQSLLELKDADGVFFMKEFIKAAKEKGAAWVDYKWSNPTTKKVEQKSSYVKRMPGTDYFLGCGIYLKR